MSQEIPSEEWRDIPGWEGFYQISTNGEVRSLPREVRRGRQTLHLRGRMLRQSSDVYPRVTLYDGSTDRKSTRKVHRLMALTFLGSPPPGADRVCHNDGNPRNNHISNLRWDNQSGNMLDRTRHGRHYQANKVRCVNGHLLRRPNLRGDGHRICRACGNARSWANWRRRVKGSPVSPEEIRDHADRCYAKIMQESVESRI